MTKIDPKNPWWHSGVQFECQGSGRCCVSRDEYGYVYMTKSDRIRMAQVLDMPTSVFTKKYCQKDEGVYHLADGVDGRCLFLEGKQCGVYHGRPTQCRTWPFWPEVMNAKVWKNEVKSYCPGVGKGRTWTKEEIEQQLSLQEKSENDFS